MKEDDDSKVSQGSQKRLQEDGDIVPDGKRACGNTRVSSSHNYGPHLLTPRLRDGVITGYQMTCRQHINCQKELSCSVGGGGSATQRILLGLHLPDRRTHMDAAL